MLCSTAHVQPCRRLPPPATEVRITRRHHRIDSDARQVQRRRWRRQCVVSARRRKPRFLPAGLGVVAELER